ncbi:hypothetical protein DFO70_13512 [Cytobacillus firmus]|uniref:ABC-2 family transporter n=2 Tax=Cytobacillus TaxID=2675230 RepID=A0A366JG91_CYTFI|nr:MULTISPECIES: hypothetical protein [Cytobacillus]RBP85996.1 hypothetical protein DFO70_13512 [Cytobacillus firmus]TDX35522.1 hypothetical protein DFO72_12618 [Cytobacillus oceanisediminis]
MQLLKFELYKMYRQKIIYFTFILLVLFSTGFTFNRITDWEKDLYREWEGPISEEKIQLAHQGNEELTKKMDERVEEDGFVYSETEQTKMGIYETISFIINIEKNANEKLSKLEKENNYNTDLEKAMLKDFDTSYFAYNKGPEKVIDYASVYSIFLTGAMLLIGLSTIYTQEYSSGVDNYILSSKKGRVSLLWAKVSASLIYTFVIVIAWELFNLGWNVFQFGNEGWDTSIQHYFKYYFSPYSFNMLEYHFIQLGIHLLAAFSFAILIVLISSICKNSLIAFFINGAIFATPYLIVEMLMLPNGVEDIFRFSYIYIMNVEFLFDHFKTFNFFGYPILYPVVAIVWMVVVSMALVLVTSHIVRKREVTV